MEDRVRRLHDLFGKALEGAITAPEREEMETSLEDSGLALDFAKAQRPERAAGELALATGAVSWKLRSQFRNLYQPWRAWLKVAVAMLIGFVIYTVWSLREHEIVTMPVQEFGTITSSGLRAPKAAKAALADVGTPVDKKAVKEEGAKPSLMSRAGNQIKGAYYTVLAKVYGWTHKTEQAKLAQAKADAAYGVIAKPDDAKKKNKSKKPKRD